jgi:hypothetical protein
MNGQWLDYSIGGKWFKGGLHISNDKSKPINNTFNWPIPIGRISAIEIQLEKTFILSWAGIGMPIDEKYEPGGCGLEISI